ncbi:MAG: hypothetical protein R3C12_01525 [Planctomycetaceae bacterium]
MVPQGALLEHYINPGNVLRQTGPSLARFLTGAAGSSKSAILID